MTIEINDDFKLADARKLSKKIDADIKRTKDILYLLFNATQPSSADLTKEIVQGGKRINIFDKYIGSESKETLEKKLSDLQKVQDILVDWINSILLVMGEYEPLKKKIIELHEDRGFTFQKISMTIPYSISHIKKIYYDFKNKKDIW